MFNAGVITNLLPSGPSSTYSYWSPTDKGSNVTLSLSDTRAIAATSGFGTLATRWVRSVTGKSSGKWRFEIRWNVGVGFVGLETGAIGITIGNGTIGSYFGANSIGWAIWGVYSPNFTAQLYNSNAIQDTSLKASSFFKNGDVYSLAVDIDAGKFWLVASGDTTGFINGGDPVTGTSPCVTFAPGSTIYACATSTVGSQWDLRTAPSDLTLPSISGFTDGWPD